MCLIITVITKEELNKEVILKYSAKQIYLNKLVGYDNSITFGKDSNLYSLTNGMCSCDFFAETSKVKNLDRWFPNIKELFSDIFCLGIHFKLFLHDYRGNINSEKLIINDKIKMSFENLISNFTRLEENVLYICVNNL